LAAESWFFDRISLIARHCSLCTIFLASLSTVASNSWASMDSLKILASATRTVLERGSPSWSRLT